MPLISPSATQQKREALLAEEQRLSDALSDVRTGLNELTAIASLPTEVLEEVFGICVSWLYGHQKPKYRLAWTQVCRTWRRISFNSARLWRCIDLCDSRLAHEFLIRSKTAPISIVSASPLKLCTENLQPHANRLQAIDVFLFPDDMVDLFASIGPDLSNLTYMSLKIPPVSSNLTLDIDVSNVTRLVLDCVAIPWDACSGLTHLSLRGLPAEDAPSFSQLRSILDSSPHLEYVRLESIAPAHSDDLRPTRPTSLPYLRELIISGKAPLIHRLLSGLVLPTSTRLQLHCSAFDDLHALFPANQQWQRSEVDTLRLLRRMTNLMRAGITPWADEPLDSLLSISSLSPMSNTILTSLNIILDPTCITTLELSAGVLLEIHSTPLMEFLTQAKNLEFLRVASNNLQELIHALTPASSSSNTGPTCPRLLTISFGRSGDVWGDFSEQWLEPLVALAKARHVCFVSLASIEFNQCHGVGPDTMRLFDGIVPEVNISEQVGVVPSRWPMHG